MDDFPRGGDIATTRAWLDRKGFDRKFNGWEANAILGLTETQIRSKCDNNLEDQDKADMLLGYLNFVRLLPSQTGKLFHYPQFGFPITFHP